MADFQEQVMGLTGLTIDASSTTPSRAEFSTFLNDGVIDVTRKCIATMPQEIDGFLRQSSEQTSNGFNPGTTQIIAVMRENGTNNQWFPCTKSNMALEYRVTDATSLHYASKYNPVYMISQNTNVHVFPEPSSDGNDTFKVLYVNYDPEETDGSALDHASTGIKWFPKDKVYLVVLYAAIRSLDSHISTNSIMPSDVTLELFSPISPIVYDQSSQGIGSGGGGGGGGGSSSSESRNDYTGSVDETSGTWAHMIADIAPPIYNPPSLDSEDPEMLQLAVANELNRYNAENARYQREVEAKLLWYNASTKPKDANEAGLATTESESGGSGESGATGGPNMGESQASAQTRVAEAQLRFQRELQDRTLKIQKYTAEVQKIGAEYQVFQARQALLIAQYNQGFAYGQAQTQQAAGQRQGQQAERRG